MKNYTVSKTIFGLALASALLVFPSSLLGRTADDSDTAKSAAKTPVTPAKAEAKPAPKAPVALQTFWSRHFNFTALDAATRFRYEDKAAHRVTNRDEQYKFSIGLRVNFDNEGRTYLQTRTETGSGFNSSWTNTGIGLANRQWALNVKSFYLGQKIGKNFEGQIGGIEFDRGAGTEATYADNDGYMVGYRLKWTGSGHGWLPNKFSATFGFVGDLKTPSAFSRFHRMGEINYSQILAQKSLGKNREISLDYTTLERIHYAHGAARFKNIHAHVFDEALVESIIRATDNPTFGWSSTVSKTFDKRSHWRAGISYSDIPVQMFNDNKIQIFQNGDQFALGKRIGWNVRYAPVKDFEVIAFTSRRVDNSNNAPRWRSQIMIRYQFANLMNRALRY